MTFFFSLQWNHTQVLPAMFFFVMVLVVVLVVTEMGVEG